MTTNERLREELKKVTAERDSLKEMLGALASLDAFQKFAKRIPITAPGIPPVPSECKCLIVKNEDNQDEIYFCTIHTAAPKILEALANGNLSSAIERAVKAELDRFMKDLFRIDRHNCKCHATDCGVCKGNHHTGKMHTCKVCGDLVCNACFYSIHFGICGSQ